MKFTISKSSDRLAARKKVEVDTLSELIALVEEHGPIIVGKAYEDNGNLPTLEIYDDYRE
jgi:hypothetical protein